MVRSVCVGLLVLSVLGACSSSRTVYFIDDYHFDFAGSVEGTRGPGPRIAVDGVVYEVEEGRLLVGGVDHGPLSRRQPVRVSRVGAIEVDGVERLPVER